MIKFNVPLKTGKEIKYIKKVVDSGLLSGDGIFTQKCSEWIERKFNCKMALLTTSCTHALEMAAILSNIKPDDEIIMPSYTFVSTANAFVMQGAKIVFVDINPLTMNIDENLIEDAITEKTRAIVPVHYGGVSCEMDKILEIAKKYDLFVIEDAAQGIMCKYKGKALGTMGEFGAFSFHETKNYTCGEGGAILINRDKFKDRARFIREKGTNRSLFFQGKVDKYSWIDKGSSYLPSELNAAYLMAGLDIAQKINENRLSSWNRYYKELKSLEKDGNIKLPYVPEYCSHNGHLFYIKVENIKVRRELMTFLKKRDIETVFHYIPLHSATAGLKFSRFHGEDRWTTVESERLLRLPMYYGLKKKDIKYITDSIKLFF